jgi:DNA (cytosine-5)-methyltransferase 1
LILITIKKKIASKDQKRMPQIQTDKVQKEAKLAKIRANKSFGQIERAIVLQNNNFISKNLDKKDDRFTFIDLFAGIGGFRIGLEKNGGRCVFSSEWDTHCQKTYFDNFGEKPHGDITQIDPIEIPDHDILTAGFPCQPFSIAGVSKKNSLGKSHGFEDLTQGTLFFNVAKIIEVKKPKVFILENVKNLKSHDKGNTFKIITSVLGIRI